MLQAPPRRRFVRLVESALAQAPPGPSSPSLGPAFHSWLEWSLDLCRWRGCPLPRPVLSRLTGLAGASGEIEPARMPAQPRRSEWSGSDWKLLERWARLELSTDGAAGLAIEILEAPDAGAGVEVRLDGEVLAISGARRGDVLTVRRVFDGGAHLLEVEGVSGGRLVLGSVRLLSR
ncbi:MAG: hypothetical protein ACLGI9_18045, partial [Thermoanaerobaculia bacterium]